MFNPDLDDLTLWGLALLHVSLSVTRTARLCTAETGDEDEEDGGKRAKEHKKKQHKCIWLHVWNGNDNYNARDWWATAVREILKGLLR